MYAYAFPHLDEIEMVLKEVEVCRLSHKLIEFFLKEM